MFILIKNKRWMQKNFKIIIYFQCYTTCFNNYSCMDVILLVTIEFGIVLADIVSQPKSRESGHLFITLVPNVLL